MSNILVTGAAGFIGYSLCAKLIERGDRLIGVDNLNDYYDPSLKQARLDQISNDLAFSFHKIDIGDRFAVQRLFKDNEIDIVVNLAAQAGVRYSIENPAAYIDSNLVGFGNILEGCRSSKVAHLVYASSSSVYGANTSLPFSEQDNVDHPLSLYAASKKANELMAHTYSHLYGLPTTGLRFFTVYGPWGRPDMALFKFTKGIIEGTPIPVFNRGQMTRDFTYIDDIIEGVARVVDTPAQSDPGWSGDRPNPATSLAPYRIYNIGNNTPVELMKYIRILEKYLGKQANLDLLPMQAGDVPNTCASVEALSDTVGFRPKTTVEEGISRFVEWYKGYYGIA
ncbi:MAG: NAD-dependent epimerase [Gammaproteobacteria bacterium]|nr:NAD-dependent epimerase [Gammaproteobacteria bacterium]